MHRENRGGREERLRDGRRSARRAGTERGRNHMFRQRKDCQGGDGDRRRNEIRDDDARGISGTANDAIRRSRHRIGSSGGRAESERIRTDQPVMMSCGDATEDQKRDNDKARKASLCAQTGENCHTWERRMRYPGQGRKVLR
jgi:hypothetical protein